MQTGGAINYAFDAGRKARLGGQQIGFMRPTNPVQPCNFFIFRLEIHILRLKMHILNLKICILRLEMKNLAA